MTPRRPHRSWLAGGLAAVLCAACGAASTPATSGTGGSTSGTATAPSAAPASSGTPGFPSSIVAIGHSGLTGYNSDPAAPGTDVRANSWATGTNPEVNSVYLRVLAKNPAVKGHAANFAVDGSAVDSLLEQEKQAAAVKPAPDLVVIQSIDNDIRCDGTDEQNYEPYRRTLTQVMDALARDLPGAAVFFVSQPYSGKEYDRVVARIDPGHLRGTGPCDVIDATTDKLDPRREAYLQGLVDHYFGIVTEVCASYPTCSTDQGALQALPLEASSLTADHDHQTVQGHAQLAAAAYRALFG